MRQKKIAAYYKRQEKILKGFDEIDKFTEQGFLPESMTEVCCLIYQIYLNRVTYSQATSNFNGLLPYFVLVNEK